MPSGTYIWSQTAANNATADSAINWSEGQAPSTVNDSSRAMMAVLKKHDDDITGGIITGGTSTAFTVTSNSVFDSLAHLSGQLIAFSPHATNGASPTLNVDGLGAKPIVFAPESPVPAGTLILGTPYVVLYRNDFGTPSFVLQGGVGAPNSYSIPLGAGIDYWGSTAPSSIFAFPIGQAISRSTYATLFSLFGTTYGSGDGATTFNLPDKSGRVSAMKEASATRLTSSYFGGNSTVLGQAGGLESHTLTTAQLASHSHANSLSDPGHTHTASNGIQDTVQNGSGGAAAVWRFNAGANLSVLNTATTGISITNASAGSGSAHNNVQPTIVCNYIIRVL
jgi:microcystin-dependent protein